MFDQEPEDPHGECRHEIHRLQQALAAERADKEEVKAYADRYIDEIERLKKELAAERERADQLENNITDDEEDLRWLRDELQERLGLPNADDDALLAAVSALRANIAEAVTVLMSRDDLDGWPGIVEAAIVILEPLSGGEFQKSAEAEVAIDDAIAALKGEATP